MCVCVGESLRFREGCTWLAGCLLCCCCCVCCFLSKCESFFGIRNLIFTLDSACLVIVLFLQRSVARFGMAWYGIVSCAGVYACTCVCVCVGARVNDSGGGEQAGWHGGGGNWPGQGVRTDGLDQGHHCCVYVCVLVCVCPSVKQSCGCSLSQSHPSFKSSASVFLFFFIGKQEKCTMLKSIWTHPSCLFFPYRSSDPSRSFSPSLSLWVQMGSLQVNCYSWSWIVSVLL